MNKELHSLSNNEIINLLQNKSQEEVSKIFNVTQGAISYLMIKRNIHMKKSRLNMSKLNLDVDYFRNIDDPKKAYWIGFICADGSITKNNNKITLVSRDKEIIEKFLFDICSDHKLKMDLKKNKKTLKTYIAYSTQITNELFVKNLINLGITNKKTDILEFPKMQEKYYPYFIAGLFDGDGGIDKMKRKNFYRLKCSLISTKEILIFIKNLLKIETKIFQVTNNKDNVYRLYIYKDTIRFLEYIYNDKNCKIYLSRKYNLYKQYLQDKREFIVSDKRYNRFLKNKN